MGALSEALEEKTNPVELRFGWRQGEAKMDTAKIMKEASGFTPFERIKKKSRPRISGGIPTILSAQRTSHKEGRTDGF